MNPPQLTTADFPAFFRELWDCDPFPWQSEFARRLCTGQAPDYVAVPTGSGKTGCLDAAIFALAVQAGMPVAKRTQGRRIFFIVNRRVIVDEAYCRAEKICKKLRGAAPENVLGQVAASLRNLSGDAEAVPLTSVQLRGGAYRDRTWAASLVRPMIICSTVDQAGSRLLFRGYGVTPQARPVHAALLAQDSLLIIDEAHISQPFTQTLNWIKRYREYKLDGGDPVQLPFHFIQMTATPPSKASGDQKIMLGPKDYEHPVLKRRLCSAKPARLVIEPKAKGKTRDEQIAKRLVAEVGKILAENQPNSVAIMVNRVATARSVSAMLEADHPGQVRLLIGCMRPLDRDDVTKEIQDRLKTGANTDATESSLLIIVSTQCLEVGADLDFDVLVTEAASLDALRQRFGRLNRDGRDITARAVIVLPDDQDLPLDKLDANTPCDLIYGNSIPHTWSWLNSIAKDGVVDFGSNTMGAAVDALRTTEGEPKFLAMLSATADAPILLPAYLDCWVQTNPSPAADPDVGLFLHGPEREMGEVQVCWRADLPGVEAKADWADILSLCPPAMAECLPVPLHVFRKWLGSGGRFVDTSGDVAEFRQPVEEKEDKEDRGIPAFVWRGPDEQFLTKNASEIRPGDTIVLRVQSGGWQALGHLPGAPPDPQTSDQILNSEEVRRVDVTERAAATARRVAILRIHPALWQPKTKTVAAALKEIAEDQEEDWSKTQIKEVLTRLLSDENPGIVLTAAQRELIVHLADNGTFPQPYPDGQGFVLTSHVLLPDSGPDEMDDADSDALLESDQSQELFKHTKDVLAQLEHSLAALPLAPWRDALLAAAAMHDWGKADPRFQAMLRGTTPFAAMSSDNFLAKSSSIASSAEGRRAARERAKLPKGFRHEMLSVQMAESLTGAAELPSQSSHRMLALHLITTHHGYARPFAPLMEDELPFDVSLPVNGQNVVVTKAERLAYPAHALASGHVQRFWQMTRRYGWWGVVLLEAVLRLADQRASANQRPVTKP